jgi:hypothetical protein
VSIWPLVAVVYTHGSYSNQCWGNTPTKTGFPSTKWTIESGECWRHHFKGHIMICQAVWSSAVPQLNAEIWTVARAYKESLFVEPSSPLCHVDVHGSQMPLNAMANDKRAKFHTSGGPRCRPCLGKGRGRRICAYIWWYL